MGLTTEQQKSLGKVIDKWLKVSLQSGESDVKAARPAINAIYAFSGLKPPRHILRFPSLLACLFSLPVVARQLGEFPITTSERLWARIGGDTLSRIGEQLSLNVSLESQKCLYADFDTVSPVAYERIDRDVHNAYLLAGKNSQNILGFSAAEYIYSEISSKTAGIMLIYRRLFNDVRHGLFRNTDAVSLYKSFCKGVCLSEIILHDFVTSRLKCERQEPLSRLAAIFRHSSWWWAYDNFAILCDRPAIKFDEQGRLHCEDGLAIAFEDGCGLYVWHGVDVPENVILSPRMQTIEEIRAEGNAEVRRIRIERYGWTDYLRDTYAGLLDCGRNEVEGTQEALFRGEEGVCLVCTCPSTGRVYALQVPLEISSCSQAQNWLSGGLNRRITTAT